MAIARIEYDMSDIDDRMDYERAFKSFDMASMLWELMLNDKKKFMRQLEADNNATEREFELLEKIWGHIWDLAKEHGVEIEKLFN